MHAPITLDTFPSKQKALINVACLHGECFCCSESVSKTFQSAYFPNFFEMVEHPMRVIKSLKENKIHDFRLLKKKLLP